MFEIGQYQRFVEGYMEELGSRRLFARLLTIVLVQVVQLEASRCTWMNFQAIHNNLSFAVLPLGPELSWWQ